MAHAQANGYGDDPCRVLGELAVLLADGPAAEPAVELLRAGLGLASVALLDVSGQRLAGRTEPGPARVEVPVHGRHGATLALLVATGARPSHLPALRGAAAVIGLALSSGNHPALRLDPAAELETDREALADALHDGPVQALVVARYAADAAVRGADPATARDAVQAALVEARRFLWQLRPRGGDGLVQALDQLSSYLVEGGGEPLGLLGDVEAAAALRGPAGVLVFRLVQAVSSVAGPAVRVTLRAADGRLRADVDGGRPLPHPQRWASRARALGGDAQTQAGRVRLVLPYPDPRTAS